MTRRWLPHPVLTVVLTVVWLLLANSLSPGQIVMGLLLGWVLPLFTRRFWPETVTIRQPRVLLRLVGTVLYDILVANLAVAWRILRSPSRLQPVFVQVPLALRSELAMSVLANIICLTPGTVSSQLAPDHSALLVHALDCTDPAELIATIKSRYETPLREVFE